MELRIPFDPWKYDSLSDIPEVRERELQNWKVLKVILRLEAPGRFTALFTFGRERGEENAGDPAAP